MKPPTRKPTSDSTVQPQMAALFALKRSEKPPENFMSDFILEFQKRNYATSPKPNRSASGKKNRADGPQT